jgi:hypothetical protein
MGAGNFLASFWHLFSGIFRRNIENHVRDVPHVGISDLWLVRRRVPDGTRSLDAGRPVDTKKGIVCM